MSRFLPRLSQIPIAVAIVVSALAATTLSPAIASATSTATATTASTPAVLSTKAASATTTIEPKNRVSDFRVRSADRVSQNLDLSQRTQPENRLASTTVASGCALAARGGPKQVGRTLSDAELKSVVGGARKADIKQIDRIVGKHKLNKDQRRILHDEITGQDLSIDEIAAIAQDIAKNAPKRGKQ